MKPFSIRRAVCLAVALIGALGGPVPVSAQDTSELSTVAVASNQEPEASATAGTQSEAAAEVLPMSMRPLYHVYAAFGLAWLLIFGYAVSLRRRMAALEREVDLLS